MIVRALFRLCIIVTHLSYLITGTLLRLQRKPHLVLTIEVFRGGAKSKKVEKGRKSLCVLGSILEIQQIYFFDPKIKAFFFRVQLTLHFGGVNLAVKELVCSILL